MGGFSSLCGSDQSSGLDGTALLDHWKVWGVCACVRGVRFVSKRPQRCERKDHASARESLNEKWDQSVSLVESQTRV